ncbi:MAG: alpha-hydroxy-acid oxidizing protein [Dehalococcoidia bacterium]|nr:alpha-hydroxy-acid oxidizing protein [Chloroflexota bacterium]
MRLKALSLYDFEAQAKLAIPQNIWDFIAGGAQDHITTRRNRAALEAICLRPQFLRDVSHRDLSTTVLGHRISFPVMISPAGGHGLVHPEGDLATARAAGSAGTILNLSTSSTYSMEEVAQVATAPLWFQLYHCGEELTTMLVRRAEDAGYAAICLTVDTPLPSTKEIDTRNEFHRGTKGGDLGNFREDAIKGLLPPNSDPVDMWERPPTVPLSFSQLEWLRSLTSLPLVIKGIRTAEDARMCVENGVDGILVSNHGGRQIDSTLSSIETLPEIVRAVDDRAEVYLDSGIRRGSDVLKALALGARAVSFGRPLFWGLAMGGEEGVRQVLAILRKELDLAMGYCGATSVDQIDESILALPPNMSNGTPSYIAEIRGLASLRDDGLITNEEFEAKKRQLLGL